MSKEEVLKALFQLRKEEILDIWEIINGYKERVNKGRTDTLLMRCMFMAGFHRANEMYAKFNITKDCSLASALKYGTKNIDDYITLKNKLNIDDELFIKIIKEIGSDK